MITVDFSVRLMDKSSTAAYSYNTGQIPIQKYPCAGINIVCSDLFTEISHPRRSCVVLSLNGTGI
jgi:hypothetical protein